VLLVLAGTGFVSRTGGQVLAQPPSAVTGVAAAFTVLPAVLVGLSLLTLRSYRLDRDTVDAEPGGPSIPQEAAP
jgi:Na+/melibiose symporter-like transporter